MADQRITQLTALPKAAVAATDVLPISDISASETKKITAKDLVAAGIDLVDAGEIDLAKLDQASATKLATQALADDAVTAAKLANDSSIAVATTAPSADNFEGRGFFNNTTGNLQVHNGSTYQQVVMPTAGIGDAQVTTAKLANGAVTTEKVTALGSAAYAAGSVNTAALSDGAVTAAKIATDSITATQIAAGAVGTSELASDAVTYDKLQDVSATDRLLGRSSAGAGNVEEITCTAAGRALLDDADAAAQRDTLGLGSLARASGTWVDGSSFSGTSSGTNTGDQTISLTGDVTGSGTGSFAATISAGVVDESKLAAASVSTSRLQDDAVTAAKLANNSATIVSTLAPSGQGDFVGQGWLNTSNNLAYRWDGATWVREAGIGTINVVDSTPLSLAVTYPDAYTATLTTTLDTQVAATVWAGPASGADATPTFRALQPGDLPDATATTKGIVQPGTGLAVSSGTLNHSNAVTGATVSGITFDNQGHVTAAVPLVAGDIPVLDASKVTSGEFGTARLQDDAVTAAKLANYSTAQIGEALPAADYIGQIFFNPLDKAFFLWDGNVWQPIGISQGAVVFAGTYDAAQNEVLSLTTEGSAIGLTVGQPLPAASQTNLGYYVVVAESGTGTAPAPAVALAPPDLILSSGSAWTEIDVSSTYTSQTASNIGFTPAASIGSTSVQGAIEEVSNECRNADNLSSGTVAVARGGTGTGSYTKGDLLAATGATALGKLGVGTNGQVLEADSTEPTGMKWANKNLGTVTNVTGTGAISVANGTTTPAITVASASTSVAGVVQLSDSTSTTSSTVAATATAVKSAYDLANAAMPKAGGTFTGDVTLGVNVGLQFEGSSDDANETRLVAANPTADRTITLPDRDGTVILSGDTGTVTSTMIADGAIVNADINASAAIAGTKISPDFGSQNVVTTGTVQGGNFQGASINGGPLAGFRNAIINGNFDIWQRGTSFTGNAYGADRWFNKRIGSACTMSRQSFTLGQTDVPGNPIYFCRMDVTSVAGSGNLVLLMQEIENVRIFSGQTITVSFWAKADAARPISVELTQKFGTGGSPSPEATGVGITKVTLSTSWQKITVTATLPSVSGKTLGSDGNDSACLNIWLDAGSNWNSRTNSLGQQSGTFDIAQVQVEAGPVATPFERRPIGAELALCQRYFHVSSFSLTMGAASAASQNAAGTCYYPVEMRVNPTLTFVSGTQIAFPSGAASLSNPTSRSITFFKSTTGASLNANFSVVYQFDAEL